MDPSAQLSFSNTSVSSSLHTRIPLSLISDLIPLACAAFFLFYTICKHSIRQIRKRFGSKEDRSNRKRRLFSVFISKSDILEGHEIRIPDEAIEADEQVAADVVYSAPGLELALVPLIEVFVWANSTIIAVNSNEEWLETVGKAALAVTWVSLEDLLLVRLSADSLDCSFTPCSSKFRNIPLSLPSDSSSSTLYSYCDQSSSL